MLHTRSTCLFTEIVPGAHYAPPESCLRQGWGSLASSLVDLPMCALDDHNKPRSCIECILNWRHHHHSWSRGPPGGRMTRF